MSIVNQLIAAIMAVLIGLMSGTLYIMSDTGQKILLRQIETHAQDTATHLGLYMAPFIAAQDKAAIETTVNAIFDSGYYARIEVVSPDQQVLFSKTSNQWEVTQAPEWFIELIDLKAPEMTQAVTHNWRQVGSVYVQSRLGYAYEQLWQAAQEALFWFISLALVSTISISVLMRILLQRPLRAVELQALALTKQNFIEQGSLPKTKELRRVALAMNLMVRQVRTMFDEQRQLIERLRTSAYEDELTGLPNARALNAQLSERLEYRNDFAAGSLIYLHINELQTLNQTHGPDHTNQLLQEAGHQLQALSTLASQHLIGRLSGADFILLLDNTQLDMLERQLGRLADQYQQTFTRLTGQTATQPLLSIGLTPYTPDLNSSELLARARLAQENARAEHRLLKLSTLAAAQASLVAEEDASYLLDTLNKGAIFLLSQPVNACQTHEVSQHEVYVRLLKPDNSPYSAGEFIPRLRELGMMTQLDRAVIEHAWQHLQSYPLTAPLTINLSLDTVQDESFIGWLKQLTGGPLPARRLQFELAEAMLVTDLVRVKTFREQLQALNIGLGVDNFGGHSGGFGYLYSMQPDYLKIDGTLLQNIDQNPDERFLVRSLISIAHSLNIPAYAERVERDAQHQILTELGADAVQGYLFGKPAPLPQA